MKDFFKKGPCLYFVTPDIRGDLKRWVGMIQGAVQGGARMIQIRDKMSPATTILEGAYQVQSILKKYQIPIIINDHIDIAIAIKADGVHLGQTDISVSKARSLLGPDALIGLSVSTFDQAKIAKNEKISYIAATPVFPSKTEKNLPFFWGLENLKILCSDFPHPVFAIGGINQSNIHDVLKCGVSGAAVVSAISNEISSKNAAKKLSGSILNFVKNRSLQAEFY